MIREEERRAGAENERHLVIHGILFVMIVMTVMIFRPFFLEVWLS